MVSSVQGSSQTIQGQTNQSQSIQSPSQSGSLQSLSSVNSSNNKLQTPAQPGTTANSNKTSSTEADRYTAVQQGLANSKTAVGAASTANKAVDDQLKQVRDIATKLADDNVTGKAREKLQADYSKARDAIIASQDKATVKNGEQKTNLLTDSNNQKVASNTRGGELEVASGNNAKALGLPEKIGSAADARALLSADKNSKGSLASAEQTTKDNAARLQKADETVSKRLETASLAAKAAQRLESARSGDRELSASNSDKREQALAQARQASEQIKNQLGGLSQGNNSNKFNSLSALFG